MCALQEHVRQALASSGGVVSPSNLVKNLRCILSFKFIDKLRAVHAADSICHVLGWLPVVLHLLSRVIV